MIFHLLADQVIFFFDTILKNIKYLFLIKEVKLITTENCYILNNVYNVFKFVGIKMNDSELPPSSKRSYRETYERMMRPVGVFLAELGFTANGISLMSVLFAIITAWFYYIKELWIAFIFFTIASTLDTVDGSVARANGANRFGYVVDPVIDRYVEGIFLLGIIVSDLVEPAFVFFCFLGMIMSSYVRAKAESSGNLKDCSKVGIMERKEKLFLLGIGTFLQGFKGFMKIWSEAIDYFGPLAVSVVIVAFFSHLSAIQRLLYTRSQIYQKREKTE